MISDYNFLEKAELFAKLSGAAYKDDNSEEFFNLGLKNYMFLSNEGAKGHIACSKDDLMLAIEACIQIGRENYNINLD